MLEKTGDVSNFKDEKNLRSSNKQSSLSKIIIIINYNFEHDLSTRLSRALHMTFFNASHNSGSHKHHPHFCKEKSRR